MAALTACLDDHIVNQSTTPPAHSGLIISNPVPNAVPSPRAQVGVAQPGEGVGEVVYVSLTPGTAPTGTRASVQSVNDSVSITTSVINGGFDPVAVLAHSGDTIVVRITDVTDSIVYEDRAPVVAARPPVVVRTDPPPQKRDVPLNASIVIVFSEPIDSSTLTTATVQLTHGGTPVEGAIRPLDGTATDAAFTPIGNLDPNTDYELNVTRAVRDLSGDALETAVTLDFTTGAGAAGPVASVSLSPPAATLVASGTAQLSATLRDASGSILAGRAVTWVSANQAVATVNSVGLVTGVGSGSSVVTATADGLSGTALVTVTTLNFASVRVGSTAYLYQGAGSGTYDPPLAHTCAVATTGMAYCWGDYSSAPSAIAGDSSYAVVTAGAEHACGLTVSGAAYCWGSNRSGQVGDGSITSPGSVAVAVSGGHSFSTIGAGTFHTCGLTASGSAFCWGANFGGQLGDGTTTLSSVPVAVSGGLTFSALSVSGAHTCGLTTNGRAYCWGYNGLGQLGDGTMTSSSVPVAVSGELTFSTLNAFGDHTCGIAISGAAYCWGHNYDGQLGDGTLTSSTAPVAVTGGLSFSAFAIGAASYDGPFHRAYSHTCAITTSGVAYCWGSNVLGQLGTGSTTNSTSPVAVSGGLLFSSLSTSSVHTCGLATNGVVYCWGDNYRGELGTGTLTSSTLPVRVLGQP